MLFESSYQFALCSEGGNGSLKCWATLRKLTATSASAATRRICQVIATPVFSPGRRYSTTRANAAPDSQTTKMRRIINEAAAQVSDEEIDHDHRQHAGAKSAFEPFRQLVTKLNSKNKKNADQSKQRS